MAALRRDSAPRLIADIGGTNARFALHSGRGAPASLKLLACADYPGPGAAARAYLGDAALRRMPKRAAFAVASPVTGDRIAMTNHPWSFTIAGLKRELALDSLSVINDFAAIALALPALGEPDLVKVGGGAPASGAPLAVLGPGTGLGAAALVPGDGGPVPVATEGGHVTLAASDAREAAVIAAMAGRFGHVSAERALSGPGLVNLHAALASLDGASLDGADAGTPTPEEITAGAIAGADALCESALDMFFSMLGTVAGNLALSLGARGGVYIAGGIVPGLADALAASRFRARFEDKGRFRGYMEAIPTFVIIRPQPALIGLAALLDAEPR